MRRGVLGIAQSWRGKAEIRSRPGVFLLLLGMRLAIIVHSGCPKWAFSDFVKRELKRPHRDTIWK